LFQLTFVFKVLGSSLFAAQVIQELLEDFNNDLGFVGRKVASELGVPPVE